MDAEAKIQYELDKIRERARISPPGLVYVDCAPLVDIDANGGAPDGAPELISSRDQWLLLEKFESDGLIWIMDRDEKERGAWIALVGLERHEASTAKPDLEHGVFVVEGKVVAVSSTGAENNPLRLLKTLLKKPERDWFEDEILEDWEGLNFEMRRKRMPRNQVYQAARVLNQKIAEQTQVQEFLIFNTKKYRINPKYLAGS